MSWQVVAVILGTLLFIVLCLVVVLYGSYLDEKNKVANRYLDHQDQVFELMKEQNEGGVQPGNLGALSEFMRRQHGG